MNTINFKKLVEKVEQLLDLPDELRTLIQEVKNDLNGLEEDPSKENPNRNALQRFQDWVNKRYDKWRIYTCISAVLILSLLVSASIYLFNYCILQYPIGIIDNIVNENTIGKTGIQVLIGLLAVIVMAGVFYLVNSPHRRDAHPRIIKLLRIIIVFIFIFICLEFLKYPFFNLFIFVSLSCLLAMVFLLLKELFRG